MISFAVTPKLICVFVFTYAKIWFSHVEAHFILLHPMMRFKLAVELCLIIKRKNQRTNGLVNAHLINGPSVSTKHTKPDLRVETD